MDTGIEVVTPITGRSVLIPPGLRSGPFRAAGPSRNLYLNDPVGVPEEELLTGVQFPVHDLPPSP